MALTRQEDKALLESNLSAWWGSAGDSRGSLTVAPHPLPAILAENKSDKLNLFYMANSDSNLSPKYMANCEMHFFQSLTGTVHFFAASTVAR